MKAMIPMVLATFVAVPLAAQQDTTHPAAQQPAAQAAAPAVTVTDAAVGDSIVDRMPADTGSTFPATVGQLVCWMRVTGGSAGTTLHHVWYHGDTQVADVSLAVNGSPWRTWSRKTIPADWTGAWHVEIQDAEGKVLKRIDFTIGQ